MASFLVLGHYYRRLIPHIADYAESVYKQLLELIVSSSKVLETAFPNLKWSSAMASRDGCVTRINSL